MTSQEDVIPEVCTAADSTVSYRYKRRQRQTFSITSVTARMVYLINEVMGKALTATLKDFINDFETGVVFSHVNFDGRI